MKPARKFFFLALGSGLLTACATTPPPPEPVTPDCVEGEVLADGLNMRDGPGTQYDVIVTLPRGTPVKLADCSQEASQDGRWIRILIGPRGEEVSGWVSANPRFVELWQP